MSSVRMYVYIETFCEFVCEKREKFIEP